MIASKEDAITIFYSHKMFTRLSHLYCKYVRKVCNGGTGLLALTTIVDFAHFTLMFTPRPDVLGIAIVELVNAMLEFVELTQL